MYKILIFIALFSNYLFGFIKINALPTSQATLQICPVGYAEILSGANAGKCQMLIPVANAFPNSDGSSYNLDIATARYVKAPTCSGRYMSVSPYKNTTHYGNNGICYSDIGLYCKTYASSTNVIQMPNGKQITCWDNKEHCSDSTFGILYNFSGNNDKCSKFNYSCSIGRLYGLKNSIVPPSGKFSNVDFSKYSNSTNLFNAISSKDTKATTYVSTFVGGGEVILNDNNGSMCVELQNSTLNQPSTQTYTVDGKTKSIF